MKLPPKSRSRLLVPGAIGLALIAGGIAAVLLTQQLVERARAEQKAADSERQAAQNRLGRATDEEREIREKLVDYRKLRSRGLIGEENRVEWVDRIAAIKAARKLLEVKYTIEPQRPADYPGIAGAGDVEFLVSPMRLDMTLLHEEDLTRFLADLRAGVNSHVVVRSCTLQRAERAPAERGLAPRLRAECAIDLVTIRDRQAKSA
jgi:hypothetical protein